METIEEIENLDKILVEFDKECDKALDVVYSSLQLYNEQPDKFSEGMRNMLVEYTVLMIFGKWENFLEDTFIEYMIGGRSCNGQIISRYVMPIDKEHAYKMIKNVNSYPNWSDIENVLTHAQNFFEDGGAYEFLRTAKAELTSLKKVRNAIAHTSIRAKKDFDNLIQGKIGYLPDDISPAIFLIEHKVNSRRGSPTYCEHYITYLKNSAKMVVEYNCIEET